MINLYKLAKLEEIVFKNGLRLHFDAIALYKRRSYPSAFFLSVLALEEIGKAYIIGDFIFHSLVSGRMEDEWEQEWLNKTLDHKMKQSKFVSTAGDSLLNKDFVKTAYSYRLELLKQNSVYAGLRKNKREVDLKSKINSPFSVDKRKAFKQVTAVNDFLIDLVVGVMQKYYSYDNELVSRILDRKLFRRLVGAWKYRGHKLNMRFSKRLLQF